MYDTLLLNLNNKPLCSFPRLSYHYASTPFLLSAAADSRRLPAPVRCRFKTVRIYPYERQRKHRNKSPFEQKIRRLYLQEHEKRQRNSRKKHSRDCAENERRACRASRVVMPPVRGG